MNITFGICVSPETDSNLLWQQLNSIMNLAESLKYSEIILAGILSEHNMRMIEPFTLGICPIKLLPYEGPKDKPGHITKKKNMIADVAFYDTIIMMHDYYELPHHLPYHIPKDKDWKVFIPPIFTKEHKRHSDWIVNPNALQAYLNAFPEKADDLMAAAPHENAPRYVCGLPYHITDFSRIQYVSGGFFIIKTEVLREIRFDETLYWGDAEDVEWSERLVAKYELRNIPNAHVAPAPSIKVLKPNKWAVTTMPDNVIEGLRNYYGL